MYLIEDELGNKYKVEKLSKFCEEKNLTVRLIRYTNPKWKDVEGKRYQEYHKGFKILSEDIEADIVELEEEKIEDMSGNVLVIGDLHTPFVKDGYLKFCKKIYNKYKCNRVVFIGDILDNHYSSYHETIPDGHGAEKELLMAKKQIAEFYREFPIANVCIGNHDRIPNRKSVTSGLSSHWIKDLKEVLCTENWDYSEYFIIDDVEYTHGTGRKAINRSRQDMISVVQGHYHSDSYINFFVGKNSKRTFAMQIGCGIQESEYAFAYGKDFAKPHINVGIVINGNLPIIEYMD